MVDVSVNVLSCGELTKVQHMFAAIMKEQKTFDHTNVQ